ncbi:MAG TPA: hypothetical protein VEQ60_05660 [Longimicrobium sp.]|nr:hypothetical protein [Longimicrobium sp.]
MKIHLVFPVLLMAAACSFPPDVPLSPSPSPLRDAAVGCWRLESSPGLLGRPLEPTLVRLDTAVLSHGGLQMLLLPDPGLPRDFNHWGTTEAGDKLLLSFSNGFGGVFVRASLRGDRLRGRGSGWYDYLTVGPRGRVRGERVPCPPEPAAK